MKRGWKKHKGRDIPRILSATYCSKRTKAAKNSGNVASHSEMLTIKRKEGRRKREDVHRRMKKEIAILNANKAKQKTKKVIVTLGKESGERSKKGLERKLKTEET